VLRWTEGRQLAVLDFDTECRPMHYSDYRPESQITAIAWSWVGSDKVQCRVLEQNLSNERSMLEAFLRAFNKADVVTGHYIRKHDLPLLVEHCMHLGIPLPKRVEVSDTMLDFRQTKGLGKSQANLSATFGLSAEKHNMTGATWREANKITAAGRAQARKRVVDDVIQNKEWRAFAIANGWLGPPKTWSP